VVKNLLNSFLQVGLVYSIALIFQFFADIVFGRALSANDYGQISFIRQTIVFAITFTFLGIDSALVRIISEKDLPQYQWRKFAKQIFLIFIVASIFIALIIKLIYSLQWTVTFIIMFSCAAGSGALFFSALLRANSNFFKAQLSTQFWKIILGMCALALQIFHKTNITLALISILIAYASNILFSFILTAKFKEGSEPIPLRKVFIEGFLFWVNSGVLLLTSVADQFVIVKLLGYSAFAPYTASWNIIGIGFILVSTSLGFVIVPPMIQKKISTKSIKYLLGLLVLISFVIGTIMYKLSATIISLAYSGKYSVDPALLIFFIAVGMVRLVYVLPSAIITAWGTTKNIGEFSGIGAFGVLLNFIVAILLIPNLGIIGAVIGSLSGWVFRLLLGFVLSVIITSKQKPLINEKLVKN